MILPKSTFFTALRKAMALFAAFSFLFSDIAFAESSKASQNASRITTDPEKIIIPRECGLIKARYTANNSKRLIIHIQDAHCNYEAQSNIIRILECLIKNDGLKLVSVEGADGFIDTSWFKAFPDADIRKEVADYFMKKGEITGPEFLSITSDLPIKLFGAETREYYIENLNAFTSSYPLKEDIEKYFNQIKAVLNKLKNTIYNDELKDIDQKMQDYESKKMQFTDYVKYLETLATRHKVALRQYENLFKLMSVLIYEKKIDFNVVDKERATLIDAVTKKLDKQQLAELVNKSLEFKTSKISSSEYYDYLRNLSAKYGISLVNEYPNVFNYIIYNSVYSRIENEKLFNDIKRFEGDIKDKIFENDDQKILDRLSRHINILLGLVNIRLLNGDFDYYKAHKSEFTHESFAEFINKMAAKFGFSYEIDAPSGAINESIPRLEEFYAIAVKRDKALVDNTIQAMKKEDAPVSVLVTGGFHSEGIVKLLEAQGVSYIVICPNITKDVETPYIKILTNQRTPLEEILTDTKGTAPEAENIKGKMLAPQLLTGLRIRHEELGSLLERAFMIRYLAGWLPRAHAIAKKMQVVLTPELLSASFSAAVDKAVTDYAATKPGAEAVRNMRQGAVEVKKLAAVAAKKLMTKNIATIVTRGIAYSSPEAFEVYAEARLKELIAAVPELEAMKDAYIEWARKEVAPLEAQFTAMQKQHKAESSDVKKAELETAMDELRTRIDSMRKKKSDEIDNLIRVKYNAKLMEKEAGFTDDDLSDGSIMRNLPDTDVFKQSPEYAGYRQIARDMVFSGSIVRIGLLGDAASRLFGEGQNVDPTLSYATHDVYDVAKSRRYPADKLKGARPGISMLTRLIMQNWIFLENELKKAFSTAAPEEIAAKRRAIIRETPRIEVINNESGEPILKAFLANRHFGHDPKLVVFTAQDAYKGFDIEGGKPVLAEKSRPLPVGHGDSTMQIPQPGRSFIMDENGNITVLDEPADEYLNRITGGRVKLYVEGRVNDMLALGYSANGDSAEKIGNTDMDMLALVLSEMGDLDSLETGRNAVLEQLAPDPRIKGSSPLNVRGRQFSIETLGQSDKLKGLINATMAPFNRFMVFYKRRAFGVLRGKGLPVHFRFRDGLFYPEIVTSDLTLLKDMHAGYVMDRKRILTDYKDGVKTLEIGVNAALRQDMQDVREGDPRFLQYLDELRAARRDTAISGLEKAPGFGEKYAGPALESGAVGAIRANGGAYTAAEHGTRIKDHMLAARKRLKILEAEKSINGAIYRRIKEGGKTALSAVSLKGRQLPEDEKAVLISEFTDDSRIAELKRALEPLGINFILVKGLKKALAAAGVAGDLIMHYGVTRRSVYMDEDDFYYLFTVLSQAKFIRTVLEAARHEAAHINDEEANLEDPGMGLLSEAEIEQIAPSTMIRKAMLEKAARNIANVGMNKYDMDIILANAARGDTDAYKFVVDMPHDKFIAYLERFVTAGAENLPEDLFGNGFGYDIRGVTVASPGVEPALTPVNAYIIGKLLGTQFAEPGGAALFIGNAGPSAPILNYMLALGASSTGVNAEYINLTGNIPSAISAGKESYYNFIVQVSGVKGVPEQSALKVKALLGPRSGPANQANKVLKPVYTENLERLYWRNKEGGIRETGLRAVSKAGGLSEVALPAENAAAAASLVNPFENFPSLYSSNKVSILAPVTIKSRVAAAVGEWLLDHYKEGLKGGSAGVWRRVDDRWIKAEQAPREGAVTGIKMRFENGSGILMRWQAAGEEISFEFEGVSREGLAHMMSAASERLATEVSNGAEVSALTKELNRIKTLIKAAAIWNKNPSIWEDFPDSSGRKNVVNWMGWTHPAQMFMPQLAKVYETANGVPYGNIVVLGMGGSSRPAGMLEAMLSRLREGKKERKNIIISSSLQGEEIKEIMRRLTTNGGLINTLFIVSSKSGATPETLTEENVFRGMLEELAAQGKLPHHDSVNSHFIGITDETNPNLKEWRGRMREVFINNRENDNEKELDIGGRFSALSLFSIVPLAMANLDVGPLLEQAGAESERISSAVNNGELGELTWFNLASALEGLRSKGIEHFVQLPEKTTESGAPYVEQLVNESLCKNETAPLWVYGEPLVEQKYYADNTAFVKLVIGEKRGVRVSRFNGRPLVEVTFENAAEMILNMELAVTAWGHALGVNPFTQESVEGSKRLARRIMEQMNEAGSAQEVESLLPSAESGGQTKVVTREGIAFYFAGETARLISERLGQKTAAGVSAPEVIGAFLGMAQEGGYIGLFPYMNEQEGLRKVFGSIRQNIKRRLATRPTTLFDFGSSFHHSNNVALTCKGGLTILMTFGSHPTASIRVPGRHYTTNQLMRAMAAAELRSLQQSVNMETTLPISIPREVISVRLPYEYQESPEKIAQLFEMSLAAAQTQAQTPVAATTAAAISQSAVAVAQPTFEHTEASIMESVYAGEKARSSAETLFAKAAPAYAKKHLIFVKSAIPAEQLATTTAINYANYCADYYNEIEGYTAHVVDNYEEAVRLLAKNADWDRTNTIVGLIDVNTLDSMAAALRENNMEGKTKLLPMEPFNKRQFIPLKGFFDLMATLVQVNRPLDRPEDAELKNDIADLLNKIGVFNVDKLVDALSVAVYFEDPIKFAKNFIIRLLPPTRPASPAELKEKYNAAKKVVESL
jgi:glucose-6-phosphate isomerase